MMDDAPELLSIETAHQKLSLKVSKEIDGERIWLRDKLTDSTDGVKRFRTQSVEEKLKLELKILNVCDKNLKRRGRFTTMKKLHR